MTSRTGFWPMDHDGLAALLARRDLSWEKARVYLALADMTRGYGKDRDRVSLSQIAERSSVGDNHVPEVLQELKEMGLYGQAPDPGVSGQDVVRWIVWPAPAMVQGTPLAGSTGTPLGGPPQGTPLAGRYQYSKTSSCLRKKGAQQKPTDPRVREFIDWFVAKHLEATGRKYIVAGGKDGKLVKTLLAAMDLGELQGAAAAMLSDTWARDKADVGLLSNQINRWTKASGTAGRPGEDVLGQRNLEIIRGGAE